MMLRVKYVDLVLFTWGVLFVGPGNGGERKLENTIRSQWLSGFDDGRQGADESKRQVDHPIVRADVDTALEKFVKQYETRNQVTVRNLDDMRPVHSFNGTTYFTSGIIQLMLKVESKSGGDVFQSSVLMKIPQLGKMYEHATKMLYYPKEVYMYEEVIPLLYENAPFEAPAPHFYASTESGILVLENLEESGYHGTPMGQLLKYESCEAVWRTLARFHGLSMLHLDEISERIDSLSVMERNQDEWSTVVFPATMRKLKDLVLPSCSESINKLFEGTRNNAGRITDSGFHPDPDGINVLLHGDAHLSNILFREDEERGELKVKFVDFQESRRGSPIIDLMYFTVTSVHFKVLDEHRDDLFNLYVRELNSTLAKMGGTGKSPAYSFERISADFQKYKAFFFLQFCAIVPSVWMGNADGETDGSSNYDGNDSIGALLISEKYISAFKGWARHLM